MFGLKTTNQRNKQIKNKNNRPPPPSKLPPQDSSDMQLYWLALIADFPQLRITGKSVNEGLAALCWPVGMSLGGTVVIKLAGVGRSSPL